MPALSCFQLSSQTKPTVPISSYIHGPFSHVSPMLAAVPETSRSSHRHATKLQSPFCQTPALAVVHPKKEQALLLPQEPQAGAAGLGVPSLPYPFSRDSEMPQAPRLCLQSLLVLKLPLCFFPSKHRN